MPETGMKMMYIVVLLYVLLAIIICTESAIFATATGTLDTALTPKTKKLSKFSFVALACYCIQTQRAYDRQVSVS